VTTKIWIVVSSVGDNTILYVITSVSEECFASIFTVADIYIEDGSDIPGQYEILSCLTNNPIAHGFSK
jgi:hypothetical protein